MKRSHAAWGAACTIALGVASRRWPIGARWWDKSLGDVLYPVVVYFALATIRPRWRPTTLGAVALAISVAAELLQLTELPRRLPRPFQFVLGTTFAWHDLACYVVGALLVTLIGRLDASLVRS